MSRTAYLASTRVGDIHIRLQRDGLWHPQWCNSVVDGFLTPQQAAVALAQGAVRPLSADFNTGMLGLPADLSGWTLVDDRRVLA